MQYHMSTAPGLANPPATSPRLPEVVPGAPKPPTKQPQGKRWPFVLIGIVCIAALVWGLWPHAVAPVLSRNAAPVSVRTATVVRGDVHTVLRLTGTTGAERFASLLVPRLRGSRSDSLREAKMFSTPGANYTVQSNAAKGAGGSAGGGSLTNDNGSSSGGGSGSSSGGSSGGSSSGGSNSSSSSSSSSASSGSSGSDSSSGQVASTMGQSSGGSSALKSATSRVGGTIGTAPPPVRTGGTGASGSGTLGDTGIGSTSAALAGTGTNGGGGGGGGGGDFGLILQQVAPAGSRTRKGQVVAEFDRESMMTRLEDYRAAVSQMDASFVKLKAEVEVQRKAHVQSVGNAKAALDQARLDEKTTPVLGAIEAERVRLAAEEADAKYKQLLAEVQFVEAGFNAQVKESELQLQQAHLELKRAEMNADRMLMKAPIDGLVVMQTMFRGTELAQIQQGDQLWPGMRYMQIVDPSGMIVNSSVNQVDADAVRVGAKAKIRFDAFPDLELPATVEAIGAMTRQGGMRAAYVKEIPVVLRIDRLDPRVIPDLSVSVDVEVASEKQVAVVPLAAIFSSQSGGSPSSWVYVRQGEGWDRRPVQVGLTSSLDAAVRSGVTPGDVIAVEYPPGEGESRSGGAG